MSDSRVFRVSGEGQEMLSRTIDLAMEGSDGAVAWKIDPNRGLRFDWHPRSTSSVFPTNISADIVSSIAWEWMENMDAEFRRSLLGPAPDIDGSLEVGWIVEIGCESYEILSVRPYWMIYHK